jgi:hypothetical protein
MKGNVPLDPTIDYREVVADERFDKVPARVRASVMQMLRRQEKLRKGKTPGAGNVAKNNKRLRNKQAKASRKRNRR